MDKVIIFNQSLHQISYIATTTTKGEEYDMVKQYIKKLIFHYNKLKKKRAAIFIEPQIETGYPDIVIAEFHSAFPIKNEYRDLLTTEDLKILFHIQQKRKITSGQIEEDLGYPVSVIKSTIKHLKLANMIRTSDKGDIIQSISLKKYYGINKIISIEAKLNKWSEAIRQAENNIWFSSESYVLLNKTKCNDSIQKKCIESGVGIILVNGKIQTCLKSEKRNLPVSYASLQFNEWIYRYFSKKSEV